MSKPTAGDVMAELRARFRETMSVRLAEMRYLLDMLDQNPGDAVALEKLRRHFHGCSGMGATCGFPRVSEFGDEGEGSILAVERGKSTLDEPGLARWRELVAEIERELC